MTTFFSSACLVGSNVVRVLIPYVNFEILEVIDLGLRPKRQAPLITETYGLLGTRILIFVPPINPPSSKFFFISVFK